MRSAFQPHLSAADAITPANIAYVESWRLHEALADDQVMAIIRFGHETGVDPGDSRLVTVGLPELGGTETLEVWRSPHSIQTGTLDDMHFVRNDEILYARLLVDETDFPDLDRASCAAYRRLLAFIRRQGYPYLIRVWNYLPHINLECNGIERYRAFCRGRYWALAQELGNFEITLPAACAIGTQSPGLLIYCLATKSPGIQIENPRQLSAFRYPKEYGPKSPSFSRAVLKRWGPRESHLYISGTASIVGHTTRHLGNVLAQLQETFTNLETLIEQASHYGMTPFRLSLLRVYVRYSSDLGALRGRIDEQFGTDIPTLFLRADICRSDLLVEIEGLGVSS